MGGLGGALCDGLGGKECVGLGGGGGKDVGFGGRYVDLVTLISAGAGAAWALKTRAKATSLASAVNCMVVVKFAGGPAVKELEAS